eukprot:NODE_4827_length_736_cov_7.068966_g4665_i0.p1 GENE.NODE_4827_length_736_cov_7.068966_g4665_i0~~NODE_4827_length_736_cov_7.068966_g4665_i0.p1  ORF type:complete len:211 (+),score=63.43 NODE_4827_length_736_cov_7.068966_g4665_i0:59-691(+)
MAPEVCNSEPVGPASDIWSLGCTILQMATAKVPWFEKKFESETAAFWHIAHCTSIPSIPPSVSPVGADFLRLCLNLSPEHRPSCCTLMAHEWLNPEEAYISTGTVCSSNDQKWRYVHRADSVISASAGSNQANILILNFDDDDQHQMTKHLGFVNKLTTEHCANLPPSIQRRSVQLRKAKMSPHSPLRRNSHLREQIDEVLSDPTIRDLV